MSIEHEQAKLIRVQGALKVLGARETETYFEIKERKELIEDVDRGLSRLRTNRRAMKRSKVVSLETYSYTLSLMTAKIKSRREANEQLNNAIAKLQRVKKEIEEKSKELEKVNETIRGYGNVLEFKK